MKAYEIVVICFQISIFDTIGNNNKKRLLNDDPL